MRQDIAFKTSDGTTLRGWHYLPDGAGPFSTIVMAHGFSAVKEMYLDRYAEAFANAGFACVVYDNRNFGASDGEPRQEIDPWQQVRDYSDAITFAVGLSRTDASRIGVWGSSYSGAHVLVVARGQAGADHAIWFLNKEKGHPRGWPLSLLVEAGGIEPPSASHSQSVLHA